MPSSPNTSFNGLLRTKVFDAQGNMVSPWALYQQSLQGNSFLADLRGAATRPLIEKVGEIVSIGDWASIKANSQNDYSSEIQGAINQVGAANARLEMQPGKYFLTKTTDLLPRMTLRGVWGGGPWAGIDYGGTTFQWAGPTDSVILRGFGVYGLRLEGISVDGGRIARCTGLLIDSANTPPAHNVFVDCCSFQNIGQAAVVSAPYLPYSIDGVGIQIGSALSDVQCDSVWITHSQIYQTFKGIVLSSSNAAQGGCFSFGNINAVSSGLYVEKASGVFIMDGVTGSLSDLAGVTGAFIDIAGTWGTLVLREVASEQGYGMALRVRPGLLGGGAPIRIEGGATGGEIDLQSDCTLILDGPVLNFDVKQTSLHSQIVTRFPIFLDPTARGFAPYSVGTASVIHGSANVTFSNAVNLNCGLYNRGEFSTDGGITNYVFTTTGSHTGTLASAYTGTTNAAATYAISNVPPRTFVQIGADSQLVDHSPQSDSMQTYSSQIVGVPPLKLQATGANLANNPLLLALQNGAQTWDLTVPGSGGIQPSGFALFDAVNGRFPFVVAPASPTNALQIVPTGVTIPSLIPPTLNSDGAGNLPNSFVDGAEYAMYVNAVPGFPGSTTGFVRGYTLSLSAYQHSFQLFHEVNVNKLWLRTATSASVWGAWADLSIPVAPTVTIATLPATAPNGAQYYCSDAKSFLVDGVAVGSAPVTGGGGTIVGLAQGAWRTLC